MTPAELLAQVKDESPERRDAEWSQWLAEHRRFPDPADVVPSTTGERAEVWMFSGVRVGSFDDVDEASARKATVQRARNQRATGRCS